MNLLGTLLQAAKLGVQAKAQKDAGARAQKRANAAAGSCTPCAAAAKVDAYRSAVRDQVGAPARGSRR